MTEPRITILRRIVAEHQWEYIDGFVVDATTAAMLVMIYDALSEANRDKFDSISFLRLVDFGWSHVRPAQ